jgi:diguanylate cyclase (GGDEF)-like protein
MSAPGTEPSRGRSAQGYAVLFVSFGKRLGLFFALIALVPTLALVGILVLVDEDSQEGKADSALAVGVRAALAVYDESVNAARPDARALSGDPQLASALASGSAADLGDFAARAVAERGLEALEVRDVDGDALTAAGDPNAIAFAQIVLTRSGAPSGVLAVSRTSAEQYAERVRQLTGAEVVLSRDGVPLVADVPPPADPPERNTTKDLEIEGTKYRGHLAELPGGEEEVLVLGTARGEGLLGLDSPAIGLLAAFLLLGMAFAYALARTLTGLHERVEQQAVTDPLTGLWNRRRMVAVLRQEVDRAQRFGHDVSMLVIDIDNFKEINDTLGHPQGDAVLQAIAETVRETTRSIDLGARYGGDELALVLLETGPDGALILAERLRERIADRRVPRTSGEGTMQVTVSVGVATLPYAATDSAGLLEAADQALLSGKRHGKNQTRVAPHVHEPPEPLSRPEPRRPARKS